jgi:hypothetical protein
LLDRIVDPAHDNGNGGDRLHRGANRGSRRGDDHVHVAPHEIGSEAGQLIGPAVAESGSSFGMAKLRQPLLEVVLE